MSDRNFKDHIELVDPRAVLDGVLALPISTWNYRSQDPSIRHMGPMAQDFHAAFGLGESDTHLSTVDMDGVALAAIQGVNARLEEENAALRAELRSLRERTEQIEARLEGR